MKIINEIINQNRNEKEKIEYEIEKELI